MADKKWVQHISGQGEKWEVASDIEWGYQVFGKSNGRTYWFPKSEYHLCEPPEEWEDVTGQVIAETRKDDNNRDLRYHECNGISAIYAYEGYRLRRVQLWQPCQELPVEFPPKRWAFIVERRK